MSDEPGISVIAALTRPPVQLSATATRVPAARLASTTSRALSTSSAGRRVSGMEAHPDAGHRLGGNAFAAPSEAKSFGRGRLDAHLIRSKSENGRHSLAHC